MGRKILVPTTVETALRARHTLVATALVALLVLALALAAPVSAQEETNRTKTGAKDKTASGDQYELVQGDEQQAEGSSEEAETPTTARAADTLQGADALIIKDDSDGTVDRIEITAADCAIEKGATVTVEDGAGIPATFVDGDIRNDDEVTATIESTQEQIVIDNFAADQLDDNFGAEGNEAGEVTDSSGITCGRDDDGGNAAGGDENQGDNTKNNDDLEDLSCEELLVLFRGESSSGEQYADAAFFADSEVRAQVEVCLEKEIVEGTAADEDLPDTGGPSLLALAVLGFVSAAAGLSVIRGGRR